MQTWLCVNNHISVCLFGFFPPWATSSTLYAYIPLYNSTLQTASCLEDVCILGRYQIHEIHLTMKVSEITNLF